jgi:hypothetical protein
MDSEIKRTMNYGNRANRSTVVEMLVMIDRSLSRSYIETKLRLSPLSIMCNGVRMVGCCFVINNQNAFIP